MYFKWCIKVQSSVLKFAKVLTLYLSCDLCPYWQSMTCHDMTDNAVTCGLIYLEKIAQDKTSGETIHNHQSHRRGCPELRKKSPMGDDISIDTCTAGVQIENAHSSGRINVLRQCVISLTTARFTWPPQHSCTTSRAILTMLTSQTTASRHILEQFLNHTMHVIHSYRNTR